MAIFHLSDNSIAPVDPTNFWIEGIKERGDLQRVLRTHLEAILPDVLLISEEFGQWSDSKRRVDLLGLDKQANLVVIELKRSEDGGHMELQAIRYGAMVSAMTFDQAVAARDAFQRKNEIEADAQTPILDFLGWEEPDEDEFAQEVRIVLIAGDFSKELTTAVMWLNTHDLDIRCVRLRPYTFKGEILLDVQQVIPLPEAAEYQVKIKEKAQRERAGKQSKVDFTRYDVTINGQTHEGLWKRRALLLVVKTLVDSGVSPDDISRLIEWRKNLWWRVEGDVKAEEFLKRASGDATSHGRTFDPKRWFYEDEHLMHFNGQTYAFSNQWGGRWSEAIDVMGETYPHLKIAYKPTNGEDEAAEE